MNFEIQRLEHFSLLDTKSVKNLE